MRENRLLVLSLAILFAAVSGGCSPDAPKQEMPVVNEENCKAENISKIEDKVMREQFASMCLRRDSGFKPSVKREW